MPLPTATLTDQDARALIEERCITVTAGHRVGAEVEWFPVRGDDLSEPVDHATVRSLIEATPLRAGCRITYEPGGQLELSSPPLAGSAEVCEHVRADAGAVRAALATAGIATAGFGFDPFRTAERVVDAPRYRAMEAFFDADGPHGRQMMRSTAAVQVNLDAGGAGEADRRWRLANAIAPMLGAAFANSPLARGRPTGWRSTRLGTWWQMDRGRTWPAVSDAGIANDWARYALSARVMMIRDRVDEYTPVVTPMTFGRWIAQGHPLGYPTEDDLVYHLTTLFPPVRVRGWLELRFFDALPDPWWEAAVAVPAALLDDPDASIRAEEACGPAADLWYAAARSGLDHPVLVAAANDCFRAALDAIPSVGPTAGTHEVVREFADRYVSRARTPADDLLDRFHAGALARPRDDVAATVEA
ncbi:MAG TPA: ergothioneine biosynthesis glutamate--cysteine ligase EgtA [Actinomycetota bacterium]